MSRQYRTLCVRVCDGYYFPISFSATRSDFVRDAGACHDQRGYMGTLFYTASPGGEIEDAVDLDGRRYKDLAAAFRYRKTYVDACSCRPPPWSDSERARHASYRGDQPANSVASASAIVVAGNYDAVPAFDGDLVSAALDGAQAVAVAGPDERDGVARAVALVDEGEGEDNGRAAGDDAGASGSSVSSGRPVAVRQVQTVIDPTAKVRRSSSRRLRTYSRRTARKPVQQTGWFSLGSGGGGNSGAASMRWPGDPS